MSSEGPASPGGMCVCGGVMICSISFHQEEPQLPVTASSEGSVEGNLRGHLVIPLPLKTRPCWTGGLHSFLNTWTCHQYQFEEESSSWSLRHGRGKELISVCQAPALCLAVSGSCTMKCVWEDQWEGCLQRGHLLKAPSFLCLSNKGKSVGLAGLSRELHFWAILWEDERP